MCDASCFCKPRYNKACDSSTTPLQVQGTRKMSFKDFENALEMLASDKGVPGEELRRKVTASGGPMCNATQAAAVRLHDDRSTYTG